jgi:hypothetical protein
VRRVREGWRKADRAARDDPAADPGPDNEDRRADALGTLDQIRREAPEDDLETRRAADALEREVERSRREPG